MSETTSTKFTDNSLKIPISSSRQHGRKQRMFLLLVAGLAVAGSIGYTVWQNQPQGAKNVLKLSGRIEGYETEIGVKRTGRVESISVKEGETVKKGQVLLQLDNSNDQLLQEQLQAVDYKIASAQLEKQQFISEVRQVEGEIEQIAGQIREIDLSWQQSQGDAQGRINQAKSNLAAAKAKFKQAEAEAKQAESELHLATVNYERYSALLKEGATAQQQFDQSQTTLQTAIANLEARQAAVNAADEQLNAARGSLTQTKTVAFNPNIRQAQLEALYGKRNESHAQRQAAQAKVQSAQARIQQTLAERQQILTQIKDANKDRNVLSPLDGVVTARNVEPGTVVNSQTNLLTVVDPKNIYLRGFIPQGEIGKVRLGQEARIFLDSAPHQTLKGKVIAVDPQASFTPENIYFQKDRVRQVVGVRIRVENPDGCFHPEGPYTGTNLPCAKIGMPGDVEILTELVGEQINP